MARNQLTASEIIKIAREQKLSLEENNFLHKPYLGKQLTYIIASNTSESEKFFLSLNKPFSKKFPKALKTKRKRHLLIALLYCLLHKQDSICIWCAGNFKASDKTGDPEHRYAIEFIAEAPGLPWSSLIQNVIEAARSYFPDRPDATDDIYTFRGFSAVLLDYHATHVEAVGEFSLDDLRDEFNIEAD